jgi:hypothetical protein
VTEEAEAGAAVHLPLDLFRFRVDAFRSSVVVREGDRSRGGLDVKVEAPGEGMQVGQVGGTRPGKSTA